MSGADLRGFLRLPATLRFEVARFHFASLPALLVACRLVRASLQSALGSQKELVLSELDAAHSLAELLALCHFQEGASLRIGAQAFLLAELRHSEVFDQPLSAAQALLLAPLLRMNSLLRRARVTSMGAWLDVSEIRNLRAGFTHSYQFFVDRGPRLRVRDRPESDADCVMLAGLLQMQASPSATGGPGANLRNCFTLKIDTYGLGTLAKLSLSAATKRVNLIYVENWSRARTVAMDDSTTQADCRRLLCFFAVVVVLMISLRVQEDTVARQMGFSGALLPQHPLKTMSFAERFHVELLPASGGSGGAGAEL